MGCGPSAGSKQEEGRDDFVPPTPVSFHIGRGIPTLNHSKSDRTIFFIFGGPGSNKGTVTSELITHYDFSVINVEDIVLNYFPKKVENSATTTAEVQDILKNDSGALSLDWIFSIIMAKLSSSMNQRFIVDIVPTLSNILKTETFAGNQDHTRILESFEQSFPIMLALDLSVEEMKEQLTRENKNKSNKKSENAEKEISPQMSAFLKGIDEADKGRLERRLDAYDRCAAPFIRYFETSQRILRVDMYPLVPALALTKTVHDFMIQLRFSRAVPNRRVILFGSSEMAFESIDIVFYNFKKLRMSDIVRGDDNKNLARQVKAIRDFIQKYASPKENIAVVLDRLEPSEIPKKKKIAFMEKQSRFLDEYIFANKPGKPFMRVKLLLHNIAFVSSEETLLFVENFPMKLAKKVSYLWGDQDKSSQEKDSS